ncbi:DUF952 domain-containing protein [Hymenobacter sp. BT175]|uniref:DUF952 domain-containing protein n=1 Tax=Hymenobacter translucens TaxID=2886507 RepID=UPI001D0F0F2C|nr:DUF952 domain-containing protein [Hymenobacter translucens]MCC2546666.1 DUF952 domain-containing protein [Hymenobacter translucens]
MLYRIADLADWQTAQQTGFFASADLTTEGFIHSSERHQILATAARYYAGRTDVLLLELDESQLQQAGIRVEREWVPARNEAFAHVFSPIPLAAIRREFSFQPDTGGQFTLPDDLQRGL